MSNPLLRPNDPRFQQPKIHDEAGQNRFADQITPANAEPSNGGVYAASTSAESQPYVAQYPVQQTSRATLLLFVGGIGWGAAAIGAVSFTGWFDIGWLGPLLGVIPAAVAWVLAHNELKAIRAGAISSAAESPARQAYWLGLTGLIACVGVVTSMIAHAMRWLPNL